MPEFFMLFSEVIGHQELKTVLAGMVQQSRLSHALLFLGKEGSGALPLAMAFAQYVVSIPPAAPAVPDLFGNVTPLSGSASGGWIPPEEIHTQPAYQRAAQLMHPDLHFTFPVIPKKSGDKPVSDDYIADWRNFIQTFPYGNVFDWLQSIGADNKQGNITASECDRIHHQMNLKSFESETKVLLMWMPEYLKKEGNKLLKLIEEPPPHSLFILVAENEEDILPTILSRCQLVRVPPLDTRDIESALIERAGADPEKAAQIAGIADGNYREALSLLQQTDNDWNQLLREWLNACVKGGPAAQLAFSEEMHKMGREKQKQLLRYFIHLLELSIRSRIIGAEKVAMVETERDFTTRINKISSVSQQEAIVNELDKAIYYIERNANAKMMFQALSIKLFYIIQQKSVLLV
ncbi:MAG: ATP-binding protein [Bacteroidota bacterium]